MGFFVASSPWPQIEQALAADAIAVLPVGAASKEHGRHLPLATDYYQAQWLATALVSELPVVVWPTLSYGYYPVFVDYPGSVSIGEATFRAVVNDILAGIERAGAARIVILNTGISTITALETCAAEERQARCDLLNVYAGPRLRDALASLSEQAWGGHADELETSIMLAIDGTLVDMSQARPAPKRIVRGLFERTNRADPNYSPDGVNGDPSMATKAKGQQFLAALLDDVMSASCFTG